MIMIEKRADGRPEVPFTERHRRANHSARTDPTNRSAMAFKFGLRVSADAYRGQDAGDVGEARAAEGVAFQRPGPGGVACRR